MARAPVETGAQPKGRPTCGADFQSAEGFQPDPEAFEVIPEPQGRQVVFRLCNAPV